MNAILLRASALLFMVSLLAGLREASSESNPPARIETARLVQIKPNVVTDLPIRLLPDALLPKQVMILIHGAPSTLTFTKGRSFSSGVWLVPQADLLQLKVLASRQALGLQAHLTISLVSLDGTVLAERRMMLDVSETSNDTKSQASIASPPLADTRSTASEVMPARRDDPLPPPSHSGVRIVPTESRPGSLERKPAVLSISPAEEAERLKSGQAALALEDVAGARLILEYLVSRGSAAGAYYLAQTYDPQILARTTVGALFKPDEEVAASWYAKAAEMGHPEARKKIAGTK